MHKLVTQKSRSSKQFYLKNLLSYVQRILLLVLKAALTAKLRIIEHDQCTLFSFNLVLKKSLILVMMIQVSRLSRRS